MLGELHQTKTCIAWYHLYVESKNAKLMKQNGGGQGWRVREIRRCWQGSWWQESEDATADPLTVLSCPQGAIALLDAEGLQTFKDFVGRPSTTSPPDIFEMQASLLRLPASQP